MSAVKNGANGQILAVEKSPLMCQIAEQVLILNGLKTRVKIAEKHSSGLSLHDDMQGEKADLIIAELMDAGFFGEDILSTFLDARNRFLSSDGLMIPNCVDIFALAIESDEIRDENSCDLSQQQSLPDRHSFVRSYLTAKSQSLLDCEESYDSRTLKSLKDYRVLSKSAKIYSLSLNDREKLSQIIDKSVSFNFDLEICTRGRIDAIVCYFTIKLFDSISISSCSDNDSCWEQAIFPVCVNMAQNLDKVPLTGTIIDNRFGIRLRDWQPPGTAVLICDPIVLKCLNDRESQSCYQKFLEHFQDDSYSILDISSNPIIPILCGKILKKAKITSVSDKTAEYCIKKLSDNLDITFVAAKDIDFRQNFDAFLIDPIDDVGLLKSDVFETTFYYKEKFKPKRILPNILQIYARLIESSEISSYSKITCDERTLNFKIKDIINLFQVETFRDIEFSTSKYINLSDDSRIFDINFEESEHWNQNSIIEFTITSKGRIDAVLYWFKICDSFCPEVAIKTIDSSNRYKQALFILKTPVNVTMGDIVVLESCRSSLTVVGSTALLALLQNRGPVLSKATIKHIDLGVPGGTGAVPPLANVGVVATSLTRTERKRAGSEPVD
uniref:Uncharacterized protein n=1 Tax=Romanomermis culicivorax TaxID=13658 RepID=A0A915HSA9_ROMCU